MSVMCCCCWDVFWCVVWIDVVRCVMVMNVLEMSDGDEWCWCVNWWICWCCRVCVSVIWRDMRRISRCSCDITRRCARFSWWNCCGIIRNLVSWCCLLCMWVWCIRNRWKGFWKGWWRCWSDITRYWIRIWGRIWRARWFYWGIRVWLVWRWCCCCFLNCFGWRIKICGCWCLDILWVMWRWWIRRGRMISIIVRCSRFCIRR